LLYEKRKSKTSFSDQKNRATFNAKTRIRRKKV